MASDRLHGIRATRAAPPGYALDDQQRKAVYGSALAQFDELIAAAAWWVLPHGPSLCSTP